MHKVPILFYDNIMKNKYKVLIIACWILLIACVIFKLCGADWFIAMTDNQRFIDFCNYVQGSYWLYVVYILNNIISTSIYFMAVIKDKKPNLKWFIPYTIYVFIKTFTVGYEEIFFALDMITMILLPTLIKPQYIKGILIGFILNLGFQLISMYLKSPKLEMFDTNLVVGLIMSVDYYIMLVLYYLYRNGKENKNG